MAMTKEEILATIKEKVLSIVPNAKVMLFGSRARGDWHEESDWDILVLTEQEVTHELKEEIHEAVCSFGLDNFFWIDTVVNTNEWEEHPGWYSLWLSTKNDLVAL
ncbi:nucleotidyltransferase domain-containing protein [Ilyomonas limi]|uniref:Nucleotidyltransferase domain-containing protein n=1 Tax=Ilyomonas limi TaxID=2575867 RepID=A0A4U3L5T3_9BACT|nr:nucleotidyltransferase domain-containing protein [Ilyomonas limi]TKK70312.1 nucleotidyltransferase domain-containing protein [Ilyomonas limi]